MATKNNYTSDFEYRLDSVFRKTYGLNDEETSTAMKWIQENRERINLTIKSPKTILFFPSTMSSRVITAIKDKIKQSQKCYS